MASEDRVSTEKETQHLFEKEQTKTSDKIKGALLALVMALSVGVSSVCVPLLERSVPDFELNAIRSGTSMALVGAGLIITRQAPLIPRTEIGPTAAFCVMGFMTSSFCYLAVSVIPLSYFKSLFFTFIIITGLVCYPVLLKEQTDYKRVLYAVACIVGVILSIQPEFIFNGKRHHQMANVNSAINGTGLNPTANETFLLADLNKTTADNVTVTSQIDHKNMSNSVMTAIACVLTALAGAGEALYLVIVKKRPYLSENVLRVQFWISTASLVLSLMVMGVLEKPVLPHSGRQVLLITLHSLSFVFIWGTMMLAAKYISGNAINIIYTSLVVFMLIPQYTILSHILPGNKNWIEVLGTVLVFLGASAGSVLEILGTEK